MFKRTKNLIFVGLLALLALFVFAACSTTPVFTVSFDTGVGGYAISSQQVEEGGLVMRPDVRGAEGAELVWFTDTTFTETWRFNSDRVFSDMSLYLREPLIEPGLPHAEAVDAAFEALTWDAIKGGNTLQNDVRFNLTLTSGGAGWHGTAISWTSSDTAFIAANGTVTRPTQGQGNQVVTLTATVSRGGLSRTTAPFTLIVSVAGNDPVNGDDAAAVAAAKVALTWESFAGGAVQNAVTGNLTLPPAGAESTTVSWATNNAAVITTAGVVTRPAFGMDNATVTLTATISRGSASDTAPFAVTVLALTEGTPPPAGDSASVAAAAAAITWNSIRENNTLQTDVRSYLNLPPLGINNTTITWTSNNAAVSSTGGVIRPPVGGTAAAVTLTATVRRGTASATQTFNLTVPQLAGTGALGTTIENPHIITTASQLTALPGDFVRLGNNITMASGSAPIGFGGTVFGGNFDGAGFTITRDRGTVSGNGGGLFFDLDSNGVVRNLVANITMTLTDHASQGVGGLFSRTWGTIENVTVTGTISGNHSGDSPHGGSWVGGIAGRRANGVIRGSTNSATINITGGAGYTPTGGIVGFNAEYGTGIGIINSVNTGNITTQGFNVGGIAGRNSGGGGDQGAIVGSTNTGNITANRQVGGVVGDNQVRAITRDSFNSGTVVGTGLNSYEVANTGGIVGYNRDGRVTGAINTGSVTGLTHVGGIVGRGSGADNAFDGRIENVINHGEVTSTTGTNREAHAGGIVGRILSGGSLSNAHNTGTVTASSNCVGGIVGNMEGNGSSISRVQNDGDVFGRIHTAGILGNMHGTSTINIAVNNRAAHIDGQTLPGYANGGIVGSLQSSATPAINRAFTAQGFLAISGDNATATRITNSVTTRDFRLHGAAYFAGPGSNHIIAATQANSAQILGILNGAGADFMWCAVDNQIKLVWLV